MFVNYLSTILHQDGKAAVRLVKAGADINSANLAGQTVLHKCVSRVN